jgi:hypothetical protein
MNPGRLQDMALCLDMRPYYHDAGLPRVISTGRKNIDALAGHNQQ